MFKRFLHPAVLLVSINFSSVDSVANNDVAVAIGSFVVGGLTGFSGYTHYQHPHHPFIGYYSPAFNAHPFDPCLIGAVVSGGVILASSPSEHLLPAMAVLLGLPIGAGVRYAFFV